MSSVTLNPTIDLYIDQGNPTTSFNNDYRLICGDMSNGLDGINAATGGLCRSWLKFDLSSIPGGATITAATLNLQSFYQDGGYASPFNIELARSTNISWTTALTWNTSPSVGSALGEFNVEGSNRSALVTFTGLASTVAAALASGAVSFRLKLEDETGGPGVFHEMSDTNYPSGAGPGVDSPTLVVTYTGGAATYTAAVAGTLGHLTGSMTCTFTSPRRTASIAGTLGHLSGQLTDTFIPPHFNVAIAGTLGHLAAQVTDTFTAPRFTAAIAGTLGHLTGQLTDTFSPPVFTVAIAGTTGHLAGQLTATFTPPHFTATIGGTLGHLATNIAGTTLVPVFTCVISGTLGHLAANLTDTERAPIFTVAIAATLPILQAQIAAMHVPPTFTAFIDGTLPAILADIRVQTERPGVLDATLGPVSCQITATFRLKPANRVALYLAMEE